MARASYVGSVRAMAHILTNWPGFAPPPWTTFAPPLTAVLDCPAQDCSAKRAAPARALVGGPGRIGAAAAHP